MMNYDTRTAKLVTFGEGGDTVHHGRHCRTTGYGTPDSPHAATPSDKLTIPDGTPAIDKRPAIATSEGYKHVFRGPMVDVDLPDNAVGRCPDPSPIMAEALKDSGNEFGTMVALQEVSRAAKEERGPLDMVSISEYIAGWKAVGARIGHYENGVIVWDE